MNIQVSGEIAQQIQALADKQGTTVEHVLESMLSQYQPPRQRLTLAEFAHLAVEADLRSEKPVDTAAHSREILSTEFAERLAQYKVEKLDSDNRR